MLDTLRRGASSWVAKALLGLLVISFGIWGIADVFRGFGQGALARIGGREITTDEFQRSLQLELDGIARQIGRRLTPEQARAFGIDARVLSRLLGTAAIDNHAHELGLSLSNEAAADSIRRDPAFQDAAGNFSRVALDNISRQLGLSEQGIVQLRKSEELRDQLTGALTNSVNVPATLIKTLYDYREETRSADYFTIDPTAAIKLPDPTPAQLAETYETNKQQLMTPEYRKLAVLSLTLDEVKKRVPVSDDEVKAAYNQDQQRFIIPEKRRIHQIAFKTRADAEAGAQALAKGKSFDDVAKDAGAKPSDVDLGLLAKQDMIDEKIADAAFGLKKDVPSGVVEGRFAPVLLKVTEIQPGKQRPLDEVKGELRDELAGQKASPELQKLHDLVDDNKAAGKPLKDIAADLKLPYVEIAATDKSGKTPDGKAALDGPDAQRIIAAAFEGRVGGDGDAIELGDGGYGWADVLSVTPSKQKTQDEAAEEVKTLWHDRAMRSALAELGGKLADRASKGESFEALAKEAGGKVETAKAFKRIGGSPGLPEAAVQLAFSLAKGAASSAETRDGKSRVVFKVTDITPAPEPTQADRDRLDAELRRQFQTDVVSQYLQALQDSQGATVNQAALRRAIGGADSQQ
jgi:peptidyl-prolyl cis-trans isomerase D